MLIHIKKDLNTNITTRAMKEYTNSHDCCIVKPKTGKENAIMIKFQPVNTQQPQQLPSTHSCHHDFHTTLDPKTHSPFNKLKESSNCCSMLCCHGRKKKKRGGAPNNSNITITNWLIVLV